MKPERVSAIAGQQARRGRGRPRLEDVAALEKRLLAVALEEFVAKGYGGASMTQIVRACGISKTTIYSRFPSKEALFRAIMRDQIERLSAAASLGSGAAKPQLEQGLMAYASRAMAYSLEGELLGVNRLVLGEAQRFPELGALAAEATAMGIGQIARFIERCAEADGIPCRNAEAPASVFILMLRGWYVNAMLTGRQVPSGEREAWLASSIRTLLAGRRDW